MLYRHRVIPVTTRRGVKYNVYLVRLVTYLAGRGSLNTPDQNYIKRGTLCSSNNTNTTSAGQSLEPTIDLARTRQSGSAAHPFHPNGHRPTTLSHSGREGLRTWTFPHIFLP